MKNIKLVVTIILTFAFVACGKKDAKNTENGLVVGGLYTSQDKDGSYGVTKIVALDETTVHVRMYSNTFETKPKDVNSKDLQSFIGHAPMAKEGFLLGNPELLKVEKVAESELVGYNYYMQQ